MSIETRLARLERDRHEGTTAYRMRDGTTKYIRSKSVFDAFCDAGNGVDSPGARVMLSAVSASDGSRLHELAQSLHCDEEILKGETQQ